MKVLYFLFEGFDTTNGTNHLALTTMQTLLDNNIDVYLMTSHSKGLYSDIPESIKYRKGFTYSIIERSNVEKRRFIQRYLDGLKYAFRASKEWKQRVDEIDVVILQSTHTSVFSAYLLHKHLKKPIIYNNFDVFPDGPYYFGAINNKMIFHILSKLQNYVYKVSDKIVVISDDMKTTFIKKGISESKLITIPNWYDSTTIKVVDTFNNQFVKNFSIDQSKFIVQYAGNIGYTFNYNAVIEIAKYLKNEDSIEFHIIGTGGFEDDFKREAEENGLKNIRFFPWQDSSIINDVYCSCNLEIVPLSKGVIWTSFPSKCTLLMACGRTFLCMCEENSCFYSFVNSEKIGVCISRTDYKKAAETIYELASDRSKLSELEKNAHICGEKYYSSAINAIKYVNVLKSVTKE